MEDDGVIGDQLVAFADKAPLLIAKARKLQSDDPGAAAAVDELRVEYMRWYSEAINLLDGTLRERFRAEFEGSDDSPRVEAFLGNPQTRTVHGWFRSAESTFVKPVERQVHTLREMAGALRSPLEPEASRSQRKTRRNALLLGALAAVVALLVAGINLAVRQGSGSSAGPPTVSESPEISSDDKSLSLTNYGLGSLNGGLGLAYPIDKMSHMRTAAQQLIQTKVLAFEDMTDFAMREVEGGAYILNGLMLEMGLEGRNDREVTVYDIRTIPVSKNVPLGAAFILRGAGGGDTPEIVNFNMDNPAPIARGGAVAGIDGTASPFFTTNRISLAKGQKETLSLWFAARSYASEFFVDIAFEVAGKKYIKRLDLNGQPFRVAPLSCAMKRETLGLGDGYDPDLSSKRYGALLQLVNDGSTRPSLRERDPNGFATAGCDTWYW
ncbi:hypothetical protein AB0P21_20805 [Kribbella sp. NPDC056861]|uniref:hypothetical protein n=1 Tax=Kribbella sp. NPDC056861 TaxID=3154857 RepID=UPI0034220D47